MLRLNERRRRCIVNCLAGSAPRSATTAGSGFGTVVLFAVSFLIAPGSVTPGALRAMLPFAGILAIVAVGQTLVIQQRGIDMSAVGSA